MSNKAIFSKLSILIPCFKTILFLVLCIDNGFSQDNFSKSNSNTIKFVEAFQNRKKIPGISICISYNDSIIFSEGFGYSNLESKIKVDPYKTKFRIASITKMVTAATLARIQEEGLINFNQSVYYYLDSLPKKQYDFSISQVGAHLSGIKRIAGEEKYSCDNTYGRRDFFRVFKNDSLLFKPSTNYSYSNYGYSLLGLLIEKISNKSIIASHKEYVFDRLKLDDIVPDKGEYDEFTSKFYIYKDKTYEIAPCLDCSFKYSSGCYLASSSDLNRLGNGFLFVDRLLKKESLIELVTSKKLISGVKTNYGFGFFTLNDSNDNYYYGHNGSNNGNRSLLRIYPQSKIVIAILINTSVDDIDSLADRISNLYIKKNR